MAAFLNLTPSQSIAAIVGARGEVDDLFLHGTLTRHPSGLFVLPAPPEMEEADSIADADVEVIFRLLRAQFRWTVVDTPRGIHGPAVAALEQSDRTLVLTDLSVPSVRAAKRTLELLDRLGVPKEHLELVITEAVAGPLDVKEVVRALGHAPLRRDPARRGRGEQGDELGRTPRGRRHHRCDRRDRVQAHGHSRGAAVEGWGRAVPADLRSQGGSGIMKLRDRIGMNQKTPVVPTNSTTAARPAPNGRQATIDRSYQELKLRIHRELLDRIDLDTIGRLDLREATSQLRTVIAQLIDEQAMPLSQRDRELLVDEILHEVHGLGPIEPLMRDPEVSDILVNTSKQVYIGVRASSSRRT